MNKTLLLFRLINRQVAVAVPKDVLEAIVFLAIRRGAKNMMVVDARNNDLIYGDDEYEAASQSPDDEVEVITCDPTDPEIQSLAALNKEQTLPNLHENYGFFDPSEFVRDTEHIDQLPYADDAEFDTTNWAYRRYGRIKPIFYVEYQCQGKTVKAIIDGWKYNSFALANGIKKVFACKLAIGNNDDLVSIMFMLQRSNYDSFMALYRMIEALWPKYFKGQGYRSDIREEQLDEPVIGADGKRLTIYQLIGRELNLSATKVKHIRKVGRINPLHFERIEIGRFSLLQAYQESCKDERGELQPVPKVQAPVYHTSLTSPPVFSPASTITTGDPITYKAAEKSAETAMPAADSVTEATACEIPVGTVVSIDDEYITVRGICQHCQKITFIKILKNQIHD